MKKRELLTLLGYVFEGEPENQATVALAGGTNGVDRRTMKKWLEKAGIEIVKPPPSQRLQFVKRADVLIAGLVDEKRLKEAEEEHARYYDDK